MIWSIPDLEEFRDTLFHFGRMLEGHWIGAVRVHPAREATPLQCHQNVEAHVCDHGGQRVIGYYLLQCLEGVEFQAISHSVWRSPQGQLVDITPFPDDNRPHNVFIATLATIPPRRRRLSLLSLTKYGSAHETEVPFYVYMLVDPRSELPFYVGKGTGRRAKTHLWGISRTTNPHKDNVIRAIRKAGLEPRIEIVADDLGDEDIAYQIESALIRKFGRKGYEEGGILTNACTDARPPSHRGRSYIEIYGPERAQEQIEKRRAIQLARGGFGPKKHNEDTRKKLSERHSRHMLGKKHRAETIEKIRANKKSPSGSAHHASRVIEVISPDGERTTVYGSGELKLHCKERGLSYPQFSKQLYSGWPPATRGRNLGYTISFKDNP